MKRSIPLTATIFITDKCNLACKYCYEANKQYNKNTVDNIDKFIDILYSDKRYSKFDSIILDFIGGEALLETDLMAHAINKFVEVGTRLKHPWITEHRFQCFTTSNGTLFSIPKVKKFLEDYPCVTVGLSLDGCKKAHDMNRVHLDGRGSYDEILKNLQWWRHRYTQVLVKGTMNRDTLPMLGDMLINQIQLGFQPWANPIYEEHWTKEDAEEYYKQLRKVIDFIFHRKLYTKVRPIGRPRPIKEESLNMEVGYCGSGAFMVTLGMDGKLYPCHRFATSTDHKYSIGDVDHGVDEELFRKFREGQIRINKQMGNTKLPLCYSANYDINGTFDYGCNEEIMTEQEYKAYDYWNERMRGVKL